MIGRAIRRRSTRFAPAADRLERRELLATDVLTYHDDIGRDGLDNTETALTPTNVAPATFGKVGFDAVDGKVDAQPLVKTGVLIAGTTTPQDVLFVATEHDSVYAFNAYTGATLWHTSLLGAGEVPSDPVHGTQVAPEIGVTATPVIDPNSGLIYVVAMSKKTVNGTTTYLQRIHALDLTTGLDKFAPRSIDASISYPGSGPGGNGTVVRFDPMQYKERDALLLLNGIVYTSWASHSDVAPYTGWVIGFDASNLALALVLNVNPNGKPVSPFLDDGSGTSFWNSGGGPASDGTFLYNSTANGPFDTNLNASGFPSNGDYGNSVVKIAPVFGGAVVVDYWTPSNQQALANADLDLGSGGVAIAPGGQVAVTGGKDGNLYVLRTGYLGKYGPTSNKILQEIVGGVGGPLFSTPAFLNGKVYLAGVGATLRSYAFANGQFGAKPASESLNTFGYPGATPSISANAGASGIVWAVQGGSSPVLFAYDASDLTKLLYATSVAVNGRDAPPATSTFVTPTVANGFVYVPTATGVAVYGLLPIAPPTLLIPASAVPTVVTGTTTTLGAYATDATYPPSSLTYIWSPVSIPSGAAAPTISPGPSYSARVSSVVFHAVGQYTFQVVIADPSYRTVTSRINILVRPTAQALYLAPGGSILRAGQSQAFAVAALDQFAALYVPDPSSVAFAVFPGTGAGTITPAGVYTAPTATGGLASVVATDGATRAQATVSYSATGPFAVHVNFTNNPAIAPPGYLADVGRAYAPRSNGLSYGWNADATASAAERYSPASPDALHDGFVAMQGPTDPDASWTIAIPNGLYYVRIIAGDPSGATGLQKIAANGQVVVNAATSAASPWAVNTIAVAVTNGLLVVSNAPGASGDTLDAIDIVPTGSTGTAIATATASAAIAHAATVATPAATTPSLSPSPSPPVSVALAVGGPPASPSRTAAVVSSRPAQPAASRPWDRWFRA